MTHPISPELLEAAFTAARTSGDVHHRNAAAAKNTPRQISIGGVKVSTVDLLDCIFDKGGWEKVRSHLMCLLCEAWVTTPLRMRTLSPHWLIWCTLLMWVYARYRSLPLQCPTSHCTTGCVSLSTPTLTLECTNYPNWCLRVQSDTTALHTEAPRAVHSGAGSVWHARLARALVATARAGPSRDHSHTLPLLSLGAGKVQYRPR